MPHPTSTTPRARQHHEAVLTHGPPPASQSPCVSTNENHGIFRAQAIGCIYVLSCRAYPDIPRACLVRLVLKAPSRRGTPVARSPSNPAHSTMYNAVLGARDGSKADAAAPGSGGATAQVAVSPLPPQPQPHEVVLALEATRDHREAEIRMGLRALVTRGDMLRGVGSLLSPRRLSSLSSCSDPGITSLLPLEN